MSGYDIGIETVLRYSSEICGDSIPGTIFWNGPMGLFEIPQFANGTVSIARDIVLAFWRGSQILIGGGDTIEAFNSQKCHSGMAKDSIKLDHSCVHNLR